MSRSYIMQIEFEGDCVEKVRNKLKHMGLLKQVIGIKLELGDTNVWMTLGASGGTPFVDVFQHVISELEKKFKLNWDVFAWSLHPDYAYIYNKETKKIQKPM